MHCGAAHLCSKQLDPQDAGSQLSHSCNSGSLRHTHGEHFAYGSISEDCQVCYGSLHLYGHGYCAAVAYHQACVLRITASLPPCQLQCEILRYSTDVEFVGAGMGSCAPCSPAAPPIPTHQYHQLEFCRTPSPPPHPSVATLWTDTRH